MEYTLTIKLKLNVSDEDRLALYNTLIQYNKACNFVSEYIYKTKILNRTKLNKELYYKIRDLFKLSAQLSQSTIRNVSSSYQALISSKQKLSKIEYKNLYCDMVFGRDYSIKNNAVSVSSISGRIHANFTREYLDKIIGNNAVKYGTAKLFIKNNKVFLYIPLTFYSENSTNLDSIKNVVGIDRGLNFIVTMYDSHNKTKFISGRFIKQQRAKYAETRRKLQKKHTKSSLRRLRKIDKRENGWMKCINHCISKALVNNNPENTLFVLEDLKNIRKSLVKVKRKNRYYMISWAYYELEQMLKYKSKIHNDLVISIDPHYTSQSCPKCGHIHKDNRNHQKHLFVCKNCGYSSNDDRIGAMNIYNLGIRYIHENTLN